MGRTKSLYEVMLTHTRTGFTFGGDITAESAKLFRRKSIADLQRRALEKISINQLPNKPPSSTISFYDQPDRNSVISSTLTAVSSILSPENEAEIVYELIMSNSTPRVYILQRGNGPVFVYKANIFKYIHAEEKGI